MTWPQRILFLHNRYIHHGGEDVVVQREATLLRRAGHDVRVVIVDNGDINVLDRVHLVGVLRDSAWSWPSYQTIHSLCKSWMPDVVHVHNYWFLLTPSIFSAIRDTGCPVVVSLHNFRALCPAGVMMRRGKPCEECVGRSPWRGIAHRCYHDSAFASALVARMSLTAKRRGVWQCGVDRYLTPSQWARNVYIRGGFPEGLVAVHSHHVVEQAKSEAPRTPSSVVFVGRVSEEKGVQVLIDAWKQLRDRRSIELILVGDGPLLAPLRLDTNLTQFGIRLRGHLGRKEVSDQIARSIALVQPSLCQETFGLSILEAFNQGKPVIASEIGALPELVQDGITGILAPPGDPQELSQRLQFLIDNRAHAREMGGRAQQLCNEDFGANDAYTRVLGHYRQAQSQMRRG
jgi:glycosyltransferase involved in cell wall biosynthesis